MGFDSLFFARMDYQDRAKRKIDKTLEVVWRGSKSLGSSSQVWCAHIFIFLIFSIVVTNLVKEKQKMECCQIFTGIFPRHYDPPDCFTFKINDVSPPIQVNTSDNFRNLLV